MNDWICAPNWLIMTADRRASCGLKEPKRIPVKHERKEYRVKKAQKSQKTLFVPFHETCF